MTYEHAGTVIYGTMRPEDLIPAFMDQISLMIEHGHPTIEPKDGQEAVQAVGAIHAGLGAIERAAEHPEYFESEDASWDLETLFDILNSLAPEGYYFGAHEGDGSDYGFWEVGE